ncbi:response regulator [Telmatospirillum sp. J64-1]|uniref:response regulator n=1 Tax=Telmatospirillum sp. J64-1 TaxID=2502183 RepID=UPI001C8F3799|nr:response regulator [Telmatospirillum sp. J64-1]
MKLQNLRILIVDDNANMRRLIHTILRSMNIKETMEAGSGAQALEILSTWQPDLVLVDYVMEGMDGIEFTKKVRSTLDTDNKRLPIIVVTGYADLQRLHAAKEAGANDFVAKPFTTKTLMQKIVRVMSNGLTLKEMMEAKQAVPAG